MGSEQARRSPGYCLSLSRWHSGCFHRNGSANLIDRHPLHLDGCGLSIVARFGPRGRNQVWTAVLLLTFLIGAGLGSTMPAAQDDDPMGRRR